MITLPVVNGTNFDVGKFVGIYDVGITTGETQFVGTATTVTGVLTILYVGTVIVEIVDGTNGEGKIRTCEFVGNVMIYVDGMFSKTDVGT
jgi:hypothetical protein